MNRRCPLCGARKGQPCRTPSGARTWFGKIHNARARKGFTLNESYLLPAHKMAGHI